MRPASSPGTENLRANPSTKPSQIPAGSVGAGSSYGGTENLRANASAKPTSVPSPTPTGADRRPAGARTYTEGRV